MEPQLERQRLDALHKWAKRVFARGTAPPGREQRRQSRHEFNEEIALIPMNKDTFVPEPTGRVRAVCKDESASGMGIVSNIPLTGSLYFAELIQSERIFLLRLVRTRPLQGKVGEYGFEVIDRYDSFQDLRV